MFEKVGALLMQVVRVRRDEDVIDLARSNRVFGPFQHLEFKPLYITVQSIDVIYSVFLAQTSQQSPFGRHHPSSPPARCRRMRE